MSCNRHVNGVSVPIRRSVDSWKGSAWWMIETAAEVDLGRPGGAWQIERVIMGI